MKAVVKRELGIKMTRFFFVPPRNANFSKFDLIPSTPMTRNSFGLSYKRKETHPSLLKLKKKKIGFHMILQSQSEARSHQHIGIDMAPEKEEQQKRKKVIVML